MLYIVLFLHQTTTHVGTLHKHRKLYIVLFLHQTTTLSMERVRSYRCISYYSYIKPQLDLRLDELSFGCISYYSYIKPQLLICLGNFLRVVYRTIPTSNHNPRSFDQKAVLLYIVLFLHQTTTVDLCYPRDLELYIVLFLHQTTTYLHSKPSK